MMAKSGGCLVGLALLCVVNAGCKGKSAPAVEDAGPQNLTTATTAATPKEVRPKLPPDPTPYLSGKASEAPALEAELVAERMYAAICDEKHLDDRNFVLTASPSS